MKAKPAAVTNTSAGSFLELHLKSEI